MKVRNVFLGVTLFFCIADVIIYISSYDALLGEAPSIGPLVKKAVLLLLILYSSVQDDIYFGNF